MRKTLTVFVLLAVGAGSGLAREKDVDAAHYPQTAIVSDAKTGSVQTGATVSNNPACKNPQGSFMKGFCAGSGPTVHNNYSDYVEMTATIGDTVYTLHGARLLHPGEYKVRFLTEHKDTVVEFLFTNSKGKLDGAKFYVIGMAAKPQEKPKD
jgi:hypothetical protein